MENGNRYCNKTGKGISMSELNGKIVFESINNGIKKSNDGIVMGTCSRNTQLRAEQNPSEAVKFIDAILREIPEGKRNVALEIGLFNGGTHLIWKQIFKEVISLDCNLDAIEKFLTRIDVVSGSKFICSDSRSVLTSKIVERELTGKKIDMLFIDGDHSYAGCEADYINYSSMVASGGIIAFHDTHYAAADVGRFVKQLETGTHSVLPKVEGIVHIHENGQGIAYYKKP